MILPTTFFDFTQEANDFYFPPLVGTYLRILRVTVFLISLLITPAWYLMVSSPELLPGWLDFLSSPEPAALSLLSQLLVVEFLIDVLKLASLNTPDTLANSFSMLGALILGDFAVQAGWLGPEVLVYMAFVSVAGFAQPSYELGYAFKLLRVALLLATAAFQVWGFVLGFLGILVLLATTKPLVGNGVPVPADPLQRPGPPAASDAGAHQPGQHLRRRFRTSAKENATIRLPDGREKERPRPGKGQGPLGCLLTSRC